MNKISNFAKEVLSKLKGDEKGVIAAKNERKANSALNGQLAALKAKQVDDESSLEDAQEGLKNAKYPTSLITDNKYYVDDIKSAQMRVDSVQQTLDDTKASIEFYEKLLVEYANQVDSE